MFKIVAKWFNQYFSDPEAVLLFVVLALSLTAVLTLSKILAPLLAAIIIAYLLEWPVYQLSRVGIPRTLSVSLVLIIFISLLIVGVFGLLPLMGRQTTSLVNEVPQMVNASQSFLMQLPDRYPEFFTLGQMQQLMLQIKSNLVSFGQTAFSASLASIPSLVILTIYLVIVPLLVFFLLKDRTAITQWCLRFLPEKRELLAAVWSEVNIQIANYVRGKVLEILIVWFVTYVVFAFMGMNYSMLLSALVGLSVVIPFVGAVLVTIPVIVVALMQWGLTSGDFIGLLVAYTIIITLDANVLVPLLFSEAVNLHPVAIIIAILFFGGIWGFWGVFFAIPLATVVKAVIGSWPKHVLENYGSRSDKDPSL